MDTKEQTATAHGFWEGVFEQKKRHLRVVDEHYYASKRRATPRSFVNLIGEVQGLNVLDVGCGRGFLTTFLAAKGAYVSATDFSRNALDLTRELAQYNGVGERVTTEHCDALELGRLGQQFDLVVGQFVLHHIEPFDEFADILKEIIKPGGRAVFMENNAQNPFLTFARKHLAGRAGIPKFGDNEEQPFEPREIALLEDRFEKVERHFPELVFLTILNTYIFRHKRRFAYLTKMNKVIDGALYRTFPGLRKYSYFQIVEMFR